MKKAPTTSSRSRMRERDLLLFVFNKKQQMLRFAQHDRCPFSSACLVWAARGPEYGQVEFDEIIVLTGMWG
jgi:hypothetical protein